MSPAGSLLLMAAPVFLSVTAAFWPGRPKPDAVTPKCPCGCGRAPQDHNPNRSA